MCLGMIIVKILLYFSLISICDFAQKISSEGWVLAPHHIFLSLILSKKTESNLLSRSFLIFEYFRLPYFLMFLDSHKSRQSYLHLDHEKFYILVLQVR